MDPLSARTLRDLNIEDLVRAVGIGPLVDALPGIARLFDGPARALARRLEAFDQGLDQAAPAARDLLASLGTRVSVRGELPLSRGPRLFVANHPGLGDVLALLTVLDSPDLRIVARDRRFLRALPNLCHRLILVSDRRPGEVLSRVARHLDGGGAVLTFPAGRIEADPAWASPDSWGTWSASTAFWARKIRGLQVQPCLVAGVRCRGFVDPWWTRWRGAADRDWTAAVAQLCLQVLAHRPRSSRIDVLVGPPVSGAPAPEALAGMAQTLRRTSLVGE